MRIFPGAPGWVVVVDDFGMDDGRMLERNMSATPPDRAPAVKLDAEGRDIASFCVGFFTLFAARTDEGGGKDARRERRRVSCAWESWTSYVSVEGASSSSVAEGAGMRIALGGIWANARRKSCSTDWWSGMATV